MKRRILLIILVLLLMPGCTPGVPFTAQYIRTNWGADNTYPEATVIRSVSELGDYNASGSDTEDQGNAELTDALKKYDDAYFESNALLLILLGEGCRFIRHNVRTVIAGGSGIDVTIERFVPRNTTDGLVEWHVLVEIDKKYAAGDVNLELVEIRE